MREHLSDEEIAAYSVGSLDAERKTSLESHLAACDHCLDALEEGLRLCVQWAPVQDD